MVASVAAARASATATTGPNDAATATAPVGDAPPSAAISPTAAGRAPVPSGPSPTAPPRRAHQTYTGASDPIGTCTPSAGYSATKNARSAAAEITTTPTRGPGMVSGPPAEATAPAPAAS